MNYGNCCGTLCHRGWVATVTFLMRMGILLPETVHPSSSPSGHPTRCGPYCRINRERITAWAQTAENKYLPLPAHPLAIGRFTWGFPLTNTMRYYVALSGLASLACFSAHCWHLD